MVKLRNMRVAQKNIHVDFTLPKCLCKIQHIKKSTIFNAKYFYWFFLEFRLFMSLMRCISLIVCISRLTEAGPVVGLMPCFPGKTGTFFIKFLVSSGDNRTFPCELTKVPNAGLAALDLASFQIPKTTKIIKTVPTNTQTNVLRIAASISKTRSPQNDCIYLFLFSTKSFHHQDTKKFI